MLKQGKMNVLITGVGGPTPRSVAKSLKNYSNYTQYNLVGTDINKYAIGLYKDKLFDKSYLVPPASSSGYWHAIEQIIDGQQIDFALIQPELEVLEWSKRLKMYGRLPCKTLLPDYALVQVLINKSKTSDILSKYEDLVPVSYSFLRDALNKQQLEASLSYPFWVRSSSGTSGLGSLKIKDAVSLENWISINPDVKEFIASEYLPGRNYACKLLYFDGELIQAACAERVFYIMSKVAPSGITGNTSFGRLLNRPDLFKVAVVAMDELFKSTGTKKHGFFTVDLKERENGKPLVTEINVRQIAFNNCFAAGGVNFSEMILRLLAGEQVKPANVLHHFEEGLIFLRDVDEDPVLMKESDLLSPLVSVRKGIKKVSRKARRLIPVTENTLATKTRRH